MTKKDINILYASGFGILIILIILYLFKLIDVAQAIQIILTFALVSVTTVYVRRTAEIAKATKEQAEASVKMAEEMKEQRIIESRPVIIQKAQQKKAVQATIVTDYFSHFEIYNAGNGPAIEVEIFLLNEEKSWIFAERETYLRAGEAPVKLVPAEFGKVQTLPNWIEPPVKVIPIHLVLRENRTYLVSQYQSIFSYGRQPTWYQTWLPFESKKASKEGEIYIKPSELEFKEVDEKDRINAFGRSKPK